MIETGRDIHINITVPGALTTGKFEEDNPNFNSPLKYLTASSIIGDKVLNVEGEHLGSIKDIMLDIRTGAIEYYVIEFGGFLGIGEKFFAIPFKRLMIDPENKVFRFNERKETLKMPRVLISTIGPKPMNIKLTMLPKAIAFGIIRVDHTLVNIDCLNISKS